MHKFWTEPLVELGLIPDTDPGPSATDRGSGPEFPLGPDEVIVTRLKRIEDDILHILKRMADRENGNENLIDLRNRIAKLEYRG